MVIYNKKIKYNIHLSHSLDLGENEMNFKEIDDATIDIALKVFELDSIIDRVIKDIENYYSKFETNPKLISEIDFLKEWKNSKKKQIFEIVTNNYINKLTCELE